jgi:hypothetical protein
MAEFDGRSLKLAYFEMIRPMRIRDFSWFSPMRKMLFCPNSQSLLTSNLDVFLFHQQSREEEYGHLPHGAVPC